MAGEPESGARPSGPSPPLGPAAGERDVELAMLSDAGGGWPANEDAFGHWDGGTGHLVFAVADGVGGHEGGEVASRLAVATTLRAYRDSPARWGSAKRLRRAAQQANVAIHNRALAAPELGRMATTLTAVALHRSVAHVISVGDTRLYLVRGASVRRVTRDHNVASERAALGRWAGGGGAAAPDDPDRSLLTRSLGPSLVASPDRRSLRVAGGDRLVVCTDGVHTLIDDQELGDYARGRGAGAACRSILGAAKRRHPADNLTVAVLAIPATWAPADTGDWWGTRLVRMLLHRRGLTSDTTQR